MTILKACNNPSFIPEKHTFNLSAAINPIVFGNLELRLAQNAYDIEAAQNLRYRVFYEELGAKPSTKTKMRKLDYDKFDEEADHLLVIDQTLKNKFTKITRNPVIGTYRLLKRSETDERPKFYTANEYDISKLLSFPGRILELGRSCVDIRYRNRATMQLLWQGIAAYIFNFKIDLMFGCASFPGTKLEAHRTALAYLQTRHQAPIDFCPRALPHRYISMSSSDNFINSHKLNIKSLPPLIKGYLRAGGWVGDGAVLDNQFNTTDVCIVMKTDALSSRYLKHYQRSFYKTPHPQ
jgi:putative hemolysin